MGNLISSSERAGKLFCQSKGRKTSTLTFQVELSLEAGIAFEVPAAGSDPEVFLRNRGERLIVKGAKSNMSVKFPEFKNILALV